jgi:predicted amidohydrolase
MKVAAYQAPLRPSGSTEALEPLGKRIRWCEAEDIEFLCCPEAILGGLADNAADPTAIAINVEDGRLEALLAPLASRSVTTIVGFTESDAAGRLYNSAAIFHRGATLGVYRKRFPAIRQSVYSAGAESPVWSIGPLTFGLMICNDTNHSELAQAMAAAGATVLFVPSNNGLPPDRPDVSAATRAVDIALAKENRVTIVRADVAGRTAKLCSSGSSAIVGRDGTVLQSGEPFHADIIVAEV